MDCITHTPTPATVPLFVPRPKPAPADLVDDVLSKLRATSDHDRQTELLCLGLDVLKRRQSDRTPRKGGR